MRSSANRALAASPLADSPEARPQHMPGLDTLRACAIVMVICRHAREILTGDFFGQFWKGVFNLGWIGVDLFFVLSGFLIGSQLIQSVQKDGRVDFRRFYLKRSLRILPSYYAVVALYALLPSFREQPEFGPIWRFLLFVMNYGRDGDAFSHAWSLCVEEHFYLAFPLLVAAWAWRPQWFRPAVLCAMALIGVVLLRFGLWAADAPFYPAVYRPSHTHLDGLAVGVALAFLKVTRADLWTRLTARPLALVLAGVALVALGFFELPAPIPYVTSFSFVSLGFGALVAAAMAPGFWLARVRVPGAATMATLAFALYLTHKQMLHLAKITVAEYMNQPELTVLLSLVLMASAACALHFGVERPFLKLRDRLLSSRPIEVREAA